MPAFMSFQGTVTMIDYLWGGMGSNVGCYHLVTVVDDEQQVVNFVVSPTTYFVNYYMVSIGDQIIGFYDANAPTPLIYPPQFQALVIAMVSYDQNVKVDYFDSNLLSGDKSLKLNIGPATAIMLENGQPFAGNPANHNLIVVYSFTTRSIPAQTTPSQIIVLCTSKYVEM